MSDTILILWTILLVVTVLLLPLIVGLLHRTWAASRSIERYFKEMLDAGLGIADHTEHITALDDTIEVASGILGVAGEINANAETIKGAVSDRAAKLN
jgi:hypothetical protein